PGPPVPGHDRHHRDRTGMGWARLAHCRRRPPGPVCRGTRPRTSTHRSRGDGCCVMNRGEEESAMERLTHQADETVGGFDVSEAAAGIATPAEKPPRLLLTVEEAAERIGICRSNMFKLIRRGDVKSVQVGRLRRVTPAALEDYVKRLSAPKDSAA